MVKSRLDVLLLNSNETITLDSRDGETGLGVVDNGGVAINQGKIVLAASTEMLERKFRSRRTIDAEDEIILPGFVDPHTHLVFAGARDAEFQRSEEHTSELQSPCNLVCRLLLEKKKKKKKSTTVECLI